MSKMQASMTFCTVFHPAEAISSSAVINHRRGN
jgi:hypothetical protein